MGLFPYQSPVEVNRSHRGTKHFNDFCTLKGYRRLPLNDTTGPWLGKNGKTYTDRELFRKDNGWYPALIKDGVCYGWYEPREIEKYQDPWSAEVDFLMALGYKRVDVDFSEDYSDNYKKSQEFYEANGFIPRWKNDKFHYGHEELLIKHGYIYPGEPPLPVLLEEDKISKEKWAL